jgi:PAS domain S-box-containing protein
MPVNLLSDTSSLKQTYKRRFPEKLIAETLTNGFFKVDRKWTVKYWNQSAEKILGVQAADIVGMNIWEKFSGMIPPKFYAAYHNAFLQDVPVHFEEYWEEKKCWFDVITYHFDDTLSVSFKSSKQAAHSQHPAHPEQKLRILNELYKFVAEVTNDCLWEWDLQSKVQFWIDGGHKRVFGYEIEDALIPQSFWESLLHPEDKPRLLAKLNKVITARSGSEWDEEYRLKRASGDYAYVHERGHIFYDADKHATRMIGATQDITTRKLAEMQLVEERLTRQNEITQAVIKAQENERTGIGKELHDNMNQVLGAAKLYIEMAKTDEENRDMCLEKSSGYILQVIEEIRRISKTLATPGMHFIGLIESIKIVIADLNTLHALKVEFHEQGFGEKDMDENLQLNIFRIIQEQTNNILKHARATRANITLTKYTNRIVLLITDNGVGCELSKAKKGVGIMHIRSRAELFHGKVTILSKPGNGYALKVILPLPAAPVLAA